MSKATLFLEDGAAYVGRAFGARADATGEMAFYTGVTGCVEKLTDPLCAGKLIVCTFPSIGGYGVIPEDFLSGSARACGVIVRSWCEHPSNARSRGNVDDFLREQGVPGLCGVDTRALMIRLRNSGPLRGMILQGEARPSAAAWTQTPPPPARAPKAFPGDGPRVAVLDLGRGEALARALRSRGADVMLYCDRIPGGEGFAAAALSDGPDEELALSPQAFPQGIPLFAEGAGHLALARLRGGQTRRMPARHGGPNLPVKWGERVYITDQFHGFCVHIPPASALETYENLNDHTLEALLYPDAISVQFPLSTQDGPHDMGWLYDRFLEMAKEGAHAAG